MLIDELPGHQSCCDLIRQRRSFERGDQTVAEAPSTVKRFLLKVVAHFRVRLLLVIPVPHFHVRQPYYQVLWSNVHDMTCVLSCCVYFLNVFTLSQVWLCV